MFPFAKSEQIAQQLATSSQPTHLPTLITSLNFHLTAPPITNNNFAPPPAPHNQRPHSPTMSTTIPMPPSSAPMLPYACFSNDHYTWTSSPPSELHVFRFVTADNIGYVADSPTSVAINFRPFDRFSSRFATLYRSLLLSPLAAPEFRFFSPSFWHSSASYGSSSLTAKNHASNSICSHLYCSYMSGNVFS
jgi:hypothetical protein